MLGSSYTYILIDGEWEPAPRLEWRPDESGASS